MSVGRVRAKFKVSSIETYGGLSKVYKFQAVGQDAPPEGEEDARFHKYTPNGSMQMTVDNPAIDGFFEIGKSYYLDIAAAD
jgi:hypothetical protein